MIMRRRRRLVSCDNFVNLFYLLKATGKVIRKVYEEDEEGGMVMMMTMTMMTSSGAR